MEKTISEAKTEVDSFFNSTIRMLGLKELKNLTIDKILKLEERDK